MKEVSLSTARLAQARPRPSSFSQTVHLSPCASRLRRPYVPPSPSPSRRRVVRCPASHHQLVSAMSRQATVYLSPPSLPCRAQDRSSLGLRRGAARPRTSSGAASCPVSSVPFAVPSSSVSHPCRSVRPRRSDRLSSSSSTSRSTRRELPAHRPRPPFFAPSRRRRHQPSFRRRSPIPSISTLRGPLLPHLLFVLLTFLPAPLLAPPSSSTFSVASVWTSLSHQPSWSSTRREERLLSSMCGCPTSPELTAGPRSTVRQDQRGLDWPRH